MALVAGARLGPYEVLGTLGAGGMGEVYRARDPRLGRDVAIKVLPADVVRDPTRRKRFEREARAAAALNHPNIVTIHDIGREDGLPYVVTELLTGETLGQRLARGPLAEPDAVDCAVQVTRGIAAAHERGIVHRDLKPDNLFLTAGGVVKILDFGLATIGEPVEPRGATSPLVTQPGTVLGTLGYMSPEQVRGQPGDQRSDIFSFGIALYEALSGRHPFCRETAVETLAAILNEEPASLAGLALPAPLERIVVRCLRKRPDDRFHSAHDLALAFEALQGRTGPLGATPPAEGSPYPGLKSFEKEDARRFFGREPEVAALWRKIEQRNLVAVIGASGAGKTSLVRAGVVAQAPRGWAVVVSTPGTSPFLGLAQALAGELAGDAGVIQELLRFEDAEAMLACMTRWGRAHEGALVVVDQFEELFTLNPPSVQASFATLLGRVANEAGVHVLLSLRDDFLMRCQQHEALRPVFEDLTPLGPLSRAALRRALVEPAKAQGYEFEDERLIEEIIAAVSDERGALPLLAFALSRLWERRDRETKQLGHAAYGETGGVAGALAQHAESTLDRIGPERQTMVREIFRNLVTSDGTRAVADRAELLSALPAGRASEEVLEELIAARLLTTYEVDTAEGRPSRHRIEVVHESLLTAWPRLVRWRTQDEDGALLRDQLKQAARLWEERGRSGDLLWTGAAVQEYQLWRARHPGALTALEEDFSRAMAEKARRRKRLLAAVSGSVILALAGTTIVVGISRQQAARARDVARAEALRAEAGKLLALGRTYLEADTTAALAYARGSLDLFDTPDARRFALEALWRGPVARILPADRLVRDLGLPEEPSGASAVALSPDGRWLATSSNRRVLLFERDGGRPRALPRQPDGTASVLAFGSGSDLLVTGGTGQSLRLWSLPDLREIRTVELGGRRTLWGVVRGDTLLVDTTTSGPEEGWAGVIQGLRLPDGELRVVGVKRPREFLWAVDKTGTQVVFAMGRAYGVRSLDATRERVLGQAREEQLWDVAFSPRGDRLASVDQSTGQVRLWSSAKGMDRPLRTLQGPVFLGSSFTRFDPAGRRLVQLGANNALHLRDLEAFPDARPRVFGRPGPSGSLGVISETGDWLAMAGAEIAFWPLSSPQRRVLGGASSAPWLLWHMAFTADGRWLGTCSANEPPRLWPVAAADGTARDLAGSGGCLSLATSPTGSGVLVGTSDKVLLFSGSGRSSRRLFTRPEWTVTGAFIPVAFDAQGRRAMAGAFDPMGLKDPTARVLREWDLASGRERVHSMAHLTDGEWVGFWSMALAPDGSLYVSGQGGARRLVLPLQTGGPVSSETVYTAGGARSDLSRDGTQLLVLGTQTLNPTRQEFQNLLLFDLVGRTSRSITTHGSRLVSARLSASGRVIVTGDADGVVRVGPVTGEEPHLLFGHKARVTAIAISPDDRWIASASEDALSIWPMPDVTKLPLHTASHEALMATLDALTNLRVVRDGSSATGWTLEVGPFPGWKDVPTW